jgi:GDP-L-fucose synthase
MTTYMKPTDKIYVAGHRGLVGSSIIRCLEQNGFQHIVTRTHQELDLTNQQAVHQFFQQEKPDFVFLAAAKVGGIHANNTYPAEFIRDNLLIQTNVIHEAYVSKVKRLLFLGSSCIYPRDCPQPIKEDYLLTGPLEPTNRPYALAKIAGIEMCWSYNRQYGTQFGAVMPTNLYGPGDNYDLENSHVIPALIRKMHEAKIRNDKEVVIWGTGTPKREFLYVDDLAQACIQIMNNKEVIDLVNIGSGQDLTIRELAELIKDVVGFQGDLRFDTSMPDGTPRKVLDIEKAQNLGWAPNVKLRDGFKLAYEDYKKKINE